MSISLIGANGSSIASAANPVPVSPGTGTVFKVDFDNDSFHEDAFDRLRVSEPRVAFEYNFANALIAGIWEGTAYGAGTVTQNTTTWTTELNTTTATTTGYWTQSYYHVRYAPGVSQMLRFTFNFTALVANLIMRVGTFTDQGTFPSANGDGVFLEANGTGVNIVVRTLNGGGETRVAQASWNMDTFNGAGASGVTLDWTKAQHLVINYEFLGVGVIYVGFQTSAGVVWAHKFSNVNVSTVAWARTGSLPVRAECYTNGTVAQAGKLVLINCCVLQEGDVLERRGWRYFGFHSGTAVRTGGTAVGLYPLVSLRALTTNDITKRTTFIPTKASILVTTAATTSVAMQWALLALPTPLTGATFAGTAGASSFVGVDQAATATTAVTGTVLAQGVLPVTAGLYQIDFLESLDNQIKAGQNAAGSLTITGANVICLAYGPLVTAAGAGASVVASINWKELA